MDPELVGPKLTVRPVRAALRLTRGWSPIAAFPATDYSMSMPAKRVVSRKRSVVKALTYRIFIVCLDFVVIYLFTGQVEVALGFMLVSNIYTTVAYFLHERLWARILWGTELNAE